MENFIDELLAECEIKENRDTEIYYDLLLLEISELQTKMEMNFTTAEKEKDIIDGWLMAKNLQLQEKINFIELKLEAFIISRNLKTIDLPHGILKNHKSPDKIEITDIGEFIREAPKHLITSIPEQLKPDISGIREFIKTKRFVPPGVTVIPGKEQFSYKLKKEVKNGRQEET